MYSLVGLCVTIRSIEVKFNKQLVKSAFKKYVFLLAFALLAAAGTIGYGAYKNQQIAQAAGCDPNNIVYCGVNMGNLYSAYNSLDGVGKSAYNHAGVQSSKFNQLKQCTIWRSGEVSVGNTIVASNAFTYGRMNISRGQGSVQIPGGAWMRPPSVSFANGVNSISAYCHMDGQEFKWGIIGECGNPIKATPKHKNNPKGTLTKTVSKPEVKVGEVFTYTLTLKNIGNVALHNVVLKDLLPPGIVMANGAPGNPRIFEFGTLQPGAVKVVKLEVKAVSGVVYDKQLRNLACFTSNYNTTIPICDDAYVIVRKKPTPPPQKPDIKIEKDVSVAEPVEVGQPFTYTIKVTNTGDIDLKNAVITDTLPDGVIATANPNSRTVTFTIPQLKKGESKSFSFEAKVVTGPSYDVELINKACVETDEIPNEKCDDAKIRVKQPKFECKALNVATTDADQQLPFRVTFNADATASNGAVIENYIWNFGDGQSQTTTGSQVNHDYNAYGNFTATVQVKTNKGTTPVSAACSKAIEVKEIPKTPVYTCDGLQINKLTDRKYSFTTSYTAENGAVLKNIAHNFGDNTPVVNTLQTTVEHEYAEPGDYNASAVLTFTVNGEDKVVASPNCKGNVNEPPVEPKCPYPGKEHLPKDSPECKPDVPVTPETPETPVTPESPAFLPDTGAGSILGIFAATTVAGMIAYRMVWLRKFNG